jgi:tungstate transport system ATP-binding protein
VNLLLSVEDLSVRRGGADILHIPRFAVAPGEFAALIGPNGSGKSSLLLSLLGLLPRASGQIRFRGRDVEEGPGMLDYRRRIGMVFQEPLLFDATVWDNVAAGPRLRGLPRAEVTARVEACLGRFDLGRLAPRHARKLSGGEARRVSLARAFAAGPELIFFDEPFANLDPPTRQSLTLDLERALRDTGITALLVTHDQTDALRLASRIVVMQAGRIVQDGAPLDVMNRPANAFVAHFMGMETLADMTVRERQGGELVLSAGGREIRAVGDAAEGGTVLCGIRPENVAVHLAAPPGTDRAANVLSASVGEIAALGPFFSVKLDCGFPLSALVTREAFAAMALQPGQSVFASFEPAAVHLVSGTG